METNKLRERGRQASGKATLNGGPAISDMSLTQLSNCALSTLSMHF